MQLYFIYFFFFIKGVVNTSLGLEALMIYSMPCVSTKHLRQGFGTDLMVVTLQIHWIPALCSGATEHGESQLVVNLVPHRWQENPSCDINI